MLRVEGLRKHFRVHTLGGKIIEAFRDVSFEVDPGCILGIAGPSGAGKSSLLKCIYRTYLASGGHIDYQSRLLGTVDMVRLCEHDVLRLRQREIGYVTQFLNVLPRIPAVDVVAEPLVGNGTTWEQARTKARRLLNRLQISPSLWDAYPVTFSGGEKQRINLARAVIARPRLLMLDEPTASLDPEAMVIALEVLAELKTQGTTMIVIWHDPERLASLADEIYHLMPPQASYQIGAIGPPH